mmetsp:Transcript_1913/g.3076  ORF Transcript_1913/g.3076 Transcript_1913/m.3076 type:complete len:401 (-) Transcript_1913:45-1247(-)
MRRTGYVFEEVYLWHDPGSVSFCQWTQPGEHWENGETKGRLHSLLGVSGILDDLVRVRARHATTEELLRFHTPEYIERVQHLSESGGGDLGEMARFGPGGFQIATLAAGGVIAAVEAVIKGDVENAYCLVRPPGHHACSYQGMGFCILNNVVLAARHAQKALGVKRIAVVDYDVHHGNGTEEAFLDDSEVLFISVHQDNNYPIHSGGILEGNETCINIPLPPGSGNGAYLAAFQDIVLPALDRFRPELILVSSGFDASLCDPLGQMMVSSNCFGQMAKYLVDAARKHCKGRVVFAHEGGYSKDYVPFCGVAVIRELLGKKTDKVTDLLQEEAHERGYQACQPHQAALINSVAAAARLPPPQALLSEEEKCAAEIIRKTLQNIKPARRAMVFASAAQDTSE